MSEEEQTMARLEQITAEFNALKIAVTDKPIEESKVNQTLDQANRRFAAYVDDWIFLSPSTQQEYRCNYLCVQNDFHYAAGLLLARVPKQTDEFDSDEIQNESNDMEVDGSAKAQQQQLDTANKENGNQSQVENAAAKFQFGSFVETIKENPSAVTFANDKTNATAAKTIASSVEQMEIQELTNQAMTSTPIPGVEPLVVIVKDNPNDRAPMKPLEMPERVATHSSKSNQKEATDVSHQTFASFSFEKKMEMMQPILQLQKVQTINEVTLNSFLVALTTVKETMLNMGMLCDVETEHWIMMIILNTLDAESIRWWNLLMKSATPAIEILSEFLATRVENLKENATDKATISDAAAVPFRIPKRPPTPEPSTSAGKKSRSRSTSNTRPTGAIPKKIDPKVSAGNRLRSTPDPVQPDCRYCKASGHVVANCPAFKNDSAEDRETNLVRKGLCKICLLPHKKGQCQKGHIVCAVCKMPHHPFLHHRAPNAAKFH